MELDKTTGDEILSESPTPFDFYLQWHWPEHIDTVLRRMLWTWFVEAAEDPQAQAQDNHLSHVHWLIAVSPESPAEVLGEMIDFVDDRTRERIAENPQTPWQALAKLAGSEDPTVRAAVAENDKTPPEILYVLASDPHVDVRYSMAENSRMPIQVLNLLSKDDNCYVAARAIATLQKQYPCAIKKFRTQESSADSNKVRKIS